jgi:hypothetical protein
MSYVGQWEARLLAILKTAQKRRHLLYFDDLLGLFQAGRSAQSNLCVADVLKPFMERRDVRVVAETTPESWRVLRERDRTFSDLFRIVPVEEPAEAESLRILLASVMNLEGRYRCRIGIDVLPTVLDLQRRYVRDAVMPGKAAAFLRRLAAKFAGQAIGREKVLVEFQAHSGLAVSFLDARAKLSRQEILDALRKPVIGQAQALSAAADVILLAKARLNDPGRPLAALLFLGPTGVGKTQTAKALAAYLYGDVDRLVRFDMNEFVSPDSVARLVGTFHEPEGLLTGAIRRQPFAVLLFDEIEKAQTNVLDLLLQVLGEGRLTDAVGRTTDFSNTLIILTSNLGMRRSEVGLGFDPRRVDDAQTYVAAAEACFRPEFFNRLDRVVPFSRLEKGDVRRIADLLLQDLLTREGLRRRRCALSIEPLAVDRMVELAFDPLLGARALRRGLERQVVRDVAEQLLPGLPDAPTLIRVYPAPQGVQVRLVPLINADPWPEPSPAERELDLGSRIQLVRQSLAECEATCDALRPEHGFQAGDIRPEQQHYLSLRERLENAKKLLQQICQSREAPRRSLGRSIQPTERGLRYGKKVLTNFRLSSVPKRNLGPELAAAQDLHAYFFELLEQADKIPDVHAGDVEELLRELALLRMLSQSEPAQESQSCVLLLEGASDSGGSATALVASGIQQAFSSWGAVEAVVMHDESVPPHERAIRLDGPGSEQLADLEVGTHLVCPPGLGFAAIRARRIRVPSGESLSEYLASERRGREAWLQEVAAGTQTPETDSESWPPVVRVYDSTGFVFDVRSNTLTPDVLSSDISLLVSLNLFAPTQSAPPSSPDDPFVATIRRAMHVALRSTALAWLESR